MPETVGAAGLPVPGGRAVSGVSDLTAVVLPGSGSDDHFVRRAFAGPLLALGIPLLAPAPRPGRAVVEGYREALDAAAARAAAQGQALLVGGVSLGAHVAARWAAQRVAQRPADAGPACLAGLLLALPAWTARPGDAPAAAAARATAALVRASGVAGAVRAARAGAPAWLADELDRAWSGYGDHLADTLDAAAAEPGPDETALARLTVPAGVVAVVDDPVHPVAVARRWCASMPRARLVRTRLATLGADPAVLGRAAVLGWLRARGAGG